MTDYQVLLDSPGTVTSRIQIAQLGDFKHGSYGEFSITPNDVEAWQRNLARLPGGRAPIDLDHRSDRSPRNTEAAGWITAVDLDGDRPMAEVEWTPVGRQAIEEKRYLFFSPSYGRHKTETGEVIDNTLTGGALTNKPFLGSLPTITLAAEERVQQALEEDPAQRLLALVLLDVSAGERKLAVKEGNALPDGSYPIRNMAQLHSAIILARSGHGDVQAAKRLIMRRAREMGAENMLPDEWKPAKRADSPPAMDIETLKLLDLTGDATDDQVRDAIVKLTEREPENEQKTLEQQAAEQGKQLLDNDQVTALVADAQAGREAHNRLLDLEFETAFDKAVREGRAIPANHDSRKHFFTLDRDATLKDLAEGPVIVNTRASQWDNTRTDRGDDAPDGVHPESHAMHRKVLDHLDAKSLPQSEYPRVLEQMLSGDLR